MCKFSTSCKSDRPSEYIFLTYSSFPWRLCRYGHPGDFMQERVCDDHWRERRAKTPDELLELLHDHCFLRQEGWWTYEFCYQKKLRQLHIEDEKIFFYRWFKSLSWVSMTSKLQFLTIKTSLMFR